MRKLACLFLLVPLGSSCASLPSDCASGQTVVWDAGADGWACTDLAARIGSHTHQVTEILTTCEDGQVVAWDGQAAGWICTDVSDHEHAADQLGVFPPSFYYADVVAGGAEDYEASDIEGHRFCALSEARTALRLPK
ncbi:MAG: hypothetical protein ACYTA3_13665 [Planctomycetota bacterium]|jgi:hypothetical protein